MRGLDIPFFAFVEGSAFLCRWRWPVTDSFFPSLGWTKRFLRWFWMGFALVLADLRLVRRMAGVTRWAHLNAIWLQYFQVLVLLLVSLVQFCWSSYVELFSFWKYQRQFVLRSVIVFVLAPFSWRYPFFQLLIITTGLFFGGKTKSAGTK